ncbi:MAG: translation initiation factor IF-3, partial [Desulfonatronovibrio sp.]
STKARRNRQIRAREVRVINADGEQLGVMEVGQALSQAENLGMDLVEVAPNADPPVCRIMDFGKYQFQQQKKKQEAKKKQSKVQIKEIKVRPKTDDNDLNTKVRHILRFIEAGDRCKVTVAFRGRELAHKDRGSEILSRIVEMTSDVAKVEQEPRFEGRTMHLLLAPLKS